MTPDIGQNPWLWPMSAALRIGAATLESFAALLATSSAEAPAGQEPTWSTPHQLVLDLPMLRARRFGAEGEGPPVVVIAPFALHGAVLADLAPGHSVLERLLDEGVTNLVLVEWKSATPQMRFLGIDDYLAYLAVVVEGLAKPCTLVGLCQGGWLALMFAARFPEKVASLVLAGAPVDLEAAPSNIVAAARGAAPAWLERLVEDGEGLVLGRTIQAFWGVRQLEQSAIAEVLQVDGPAPAVIDRFRAWHAWTLDLPGTYYLQVVEDLFRRNKLARGEFQGLGHRLDLSTVRVPLFLIASEQDEVTAPEQLLAVRRLVGTPPDTIATVLTSGPHLALFMGARNLKTAWRDAARWLRQTFEPPTSAPRLTDTTLRPPAAYQL